MSSQPEKGAEKPCNYTTFLKWNIGPEIGIETEDKEDGRKLVTQVHCKLCSRHFEKIKKDSRIKGQAKKEIEKYVTGSRYITKWTVERHLTSKTHRIACDYERLIGPPDGHPVIDLSATQAVTGAGKSSGAQGQQPRIDVEFHRVAKDAYRKLINTAYMLAVEGKQ